VRNGHIWGSALKFFIVSLFILSSQSFAFDHCKQFEQNAQKLSEMIINTSRGDLSASSSQSLLFAVRYVVKTTDIVGGSELDRNRNCIIGKMNLRTIAVAVNEYVTMSNLLK